MFIINDDRQNQNSEQNPPVFDREAQTESAGGEPEEGVHEHPEEQSPAISGEEDASGSTPSPTSDDDVMDMVKETIGQVPQKGQTIADIVNEVEKNRDIPAEKEAVNN